MHDVNAVDQCRRWRRAPEGGIAADAIRIDVGADACRCIGESDDHIGSRIAHRRVDRNSHIAEVGQVGGDKVSWCAVSGDVVVVHHAGVTECAQQRLVGRGRRKVFDLQIVQVRQLVLAEHVQEVHLLTDNGNHDPFIVCRADRTGDDVAGGIQQFDVDVAQASLDVVVKEGVHDQLTSRVGRDLEVVFVDHCGCAPDVVQGQAVDGHLRNTTQHRRRGDAVVLWDDLVELVESVRQDVVHAVDLQPFQLVETDRLEAIDRKAAGIRLRPWSIS